MKRGKKAAPIWPLLRSGLGERWSSLPCNQPATRAGQPCNKAALYLFVLFIPCSVISWEPSPAPFFYFIFFPSGSSSGSPKGSATPLAEDAPTPCPPPHPLPSIPAPSLHPPSLPVPLPEPRVPSPSPQPPCPPPPAAISTLGLLKMRPLKAAQSPFCRRGWNTDSLFARVSVIKLNLGVNTTM